jgi:hypothetical protein
MALTPFTTTTFAQMKVSLSQRLSDPNFIFWSNTEMGLYLIEAIQTYNALCAIWPADYQFDFAVGDTWKSLATPVDSPRIRTTTDQNLYTILEYMLLEPATGATWTGTSQFSITDLSSSINRRINEMIQLLGLNPQQLTLNAPTSGLRTQVPDNTLDISRIRFVPQFDTPYPLYREDRAASNAYGDLSALTPALPDSWMVTTVAPLYFDLNCVTNQPAQFDMLRLVTNDAVVASPSTPVLLKIPNDWAWVLRWGVLADLLSINPEATDQFRAKYALQRYQRGLKAMKELPWLLNTTVASIPADTPSVVEMDAYSPNWEQSQAEGFPAIVVGGTDFIALAPFTTTDVVSTVITVVGNAPIPTADADYIQLGPDAYDQILNYAQHLATFKRGWAALAETMPLYQQFESWAALQNARYEALGIYRTQILDMGDRDADIVPRFPELTKVESGEANG